jgi:hypothetical protein
MVSSSLPAKARQHVAVGTSLFALLAKLGTPLPAAADDHHRRRTATPIEHVIVIIELEFGSADGS